MSKHTPGPWFVEENEMMGRDIVSGDKLAIVCTQVYSPVDAAIIAAAPDLLAALQSMLEGNHNQQDVREAARAAIAKATGTD